MRKTIPFACFAATLVFPSLASARIIPGDPSLNTSLPMRVSAPEGTFGACDTRAEVLAFPRYVPGQCIGLPDGAAATAIDAPKWRAIDAPGFGQVKPTTLTVIAHAAVVIPGVGTRNVWLYANGLTNSVPGTR